MGTNCITNSWGAFFSLHFQLAGQLITVLLQNLHRLDEKVKEDADGVHNTLGNVDEIERIPYFL